MSALKNRGSRLAALVCVLMLGTCIASASGAQASTYRVIYSFCAKANCTDGGFPQAALAMDGAGNLYGTTSGGGRNNQGTIFELIPNAAHTRWRHEVLYSFCARSGCPDGDEPAAGLIIGMDGSLYGTTPYDGTNTGGGNGGTVFRLSPQIEGHWKFTRLYSFCHKSLCPDGDSPVTSLSYAGQSDGQPYDGTSPLYGTTEFGGKLGNGDEGTVYRLMPDTATDRWTYDVLYSFCASGGCTKELPDPSSAVTVGTDGSLYGTDEDVDHGFNGDVYRLTAPHRGDHWNERTVYSFCALANCADGQAPHPTSLTLANSLLYGTTRSGGANSGGTVFSLDPATSQLTPLYGFCALSDCADGAGPDAAILRAATGDLYGVARSGGIGGKFQGSGTAFTLHNGSLSLLYTFCSETNCTDGGTPVGGLVMGQDATLYGMTSGGGANSGGVVFAITP